MQRLIILIALWLTACVTNSISKMDNQAENSFGLALSPASLQQTLQLSQQLTITYNNQSHQLDGLLESTPQYVQIALVKFGRRILTLHFDGNKINVQKDAMVPQEIQPEQILSDLQLAFWPYKSIVEKLPDNYTLVDEGNIRTLLFRNEVISRIHYQSTEPHWQRIELTNLKFKYSMNIISQSVS